MIKGTYMIKTNFITFLAFNKRCWKNVVEVKSALRIRNSDFMRTMFNVKNIKLNI